MKQSNYPAKIPLPWGANAQPSFINDIPTESQQSSSTPARASFTDGFPPGTFGSAGEPPYGQDFNGILQQITAGLQAIQAGSTPQFDAVFAGEIGGYPAGCILASSTTVGLYWVCTQDNNTTNPDGTSPTNWQSIFNGLAPLASPSLTGTPTTPTPANTANNTQIANTVWVTSLFAALAGNANQPFFVGPAIQPTQALQSQQALQVINITESVTITPTAYNTILIPTLNNSATITLEEGILGAQVNIFGSGGGTITVVVPNSSILMPDGSHTQSFTFPQTWAASLSLVMDGSNWRASVTGQPIALPATQNNQVVTLGQFTIESSGDCNMTTWPCDTSPSGVVQCLTGFVQTGNNGNEWWFTFPIPFKTQMTSGVGSDGGGGCFSFGINQSGSAYGTNVWARASSNYMSGSLIYTIWGQ